MEARAFYGRGAPDPERPGDESGLTSWSMAYAKGACASSRKLAAIFWNFSLAGGHRTLSALAKYVEKANKALAADRAAEKVKAHRAKAMAA